MKWTFMSAHPHYITETRMILLSLTYWREVGCFTPDVTSVGVNFSGIANEFQAQEKSL